MTGARNWGTLCPISGQNFRFLHSGCVDGRGVLLWCAWVEGHTLDMNLQAKKTKQPADLGVDSAFVLGRPQVRGMGSVGRALALCSVPVAFSMWVAGFPGNALAQSASRSATGGASHGGRASTLPGVSPVRDAAALRSGAHLVVGAGHGEPSRFMNTLVAALPRTLRSMGEATVSPSDAAHLFGEQHSFVAPEFGDRDLKWLHQCNDSALVPVAAEEDAYAKTRGEICWARAREWMPTINHHSARARAAHHSCFYMVRALLHMGRRSDGLAQARECNRTIPDLRPAGNLHPPNVQRVFRRAQALNRAEAVASLTIHSKPSQCTAYIDGRERGTTPYVWQRAMRGNHHVEVTCPPQEGHTENTWSRVHRVHIDEVPKAVYVDMRFDRDVRFEDQFVRMVYPTEQEEDSLRHADSLYLARTLGVGHLWVVSAIPHDGLQVDYMDLQTGRVTATGYFPDFFGSQNLMNIMTRWVDEGSVEILPGVPGAPNRTRWVLPSLDFRDNRYDTHIGADAPVSMQPVETWRATAPMEALSMPVAEYFGYMEGVGVGQGGGPSFLVNRISLRPYLQKLQAQGSDELSEAEASSTGSPERRGRSRRQSRAQRRHADRSGSADSSSTAFAGMALGLGAAATVGTWVVWRDRYDNYREDETRLLYGTLALSSMALGSWGVAGLLGGMARDYRDQGHPTPAWAWAVGGVGAVSLGLGVHAAFQDNFVCLQIEETGPCTKVRANAGRAWGYFAVAAPLLTVPLRFVLQKGGLQKGELGDSSVTVSATAGGGQLLWNGRF